MTDITPATLSRSIEKTQRSSIDRVRKRLKSRYRQELRFKLYGLGAILIAGIALIILVNSILFQAIPAFSAHSIKLDITFDAKKIDPKGNGNPKEFANINYKKLADAEVSKILPDVSGRKAKRGLRELLSSSTGFEISKAVKADPTLLGQTVNRQFLLDDVPDLYFKGYVSDISRGSGQAPIDIQLAKKDAVINGDLITAFADIRQNAKQAILGLILEKERQLDNNLKTIGRVNAEIDAYEKDEANGDADRYKGNLASAKQLTATSSKIKSEISVLNATFSEDASTITFNRDMPSYFIKIGGGYLKLTEIGETQASADIFAPLPEDAITQVSDWSTLIIQKPEGVRLLPDNKIVWLEKLNENGNIVKHFNWHFFSGGDSAEPEYAAIAAAFKGSLLLLFVTLVISFPIGVASAVYLEEFAPKNKITEIIEVNINNLAAVPSIIFGLLGLAIFQNFLEIPRGTALIGGMVLALMTMPTIIIASRAALRAVPPSIREAALGLGASHLQTVFHHVLPLALPGMMTGTIIGMAQALGETAPLILIGLISFVVDIPQTFTDSTAALPALIYKWGDQSFLAFQHKTAAAIVCLLLFLIVMNAMAVIIRKRFERRW